VALVSRLRARGFSLLDTQWTTAHLRTFGACDISSKEYRRQLSLALQRDCAFADPPSSDPSLPSEPINPCGFD
jgi:Leu/Phe-tRNA-protein transferase